MAMILIKERHNESGARVFGANLEGKVAYKDVFQLQLGVTASYNPSKALTLAVTGTYTGSMYVEPHNDGRIMKGRVHYDGTGVLRI